MIDTVEVFCYCYGIPYDRASFTLEREVQQEHSMCECLCEITSVEVWGWWVGQMHQTDHKDQPVVE